MKKIFLPFVSFCAISAIFSSCASYNAVALNTLSSEIVSYSLPAEKKDVCIVAKAFNKADCKRYLDRDVLAEGYQPVQLFVENNSNINYVLSLSRISLPCASPEEVARKVHTSTLGRAVGYGVGALFLWPLAIPAIVDGVKSSQANDHLDMDFSSKAARDQIIQPHSYLNKILFVPASEYQPAFTVTLMDEYSNPQTFTVKIR